MTYHGHIQYGTVLHGTLLTYDLIEAFVSELEDLSVGENDPAIKALIAEANEVCAIGAEKGHDAINYDRDTESYVELIYDLTDKINELLPEDFDGYFGAHPGDGADFGYWPSEED